MIVADGTPEVRGVAASLRMPAPVDVETLNRWSYSRSW